MATPALTGDEYLVSALGPARAVRTDQSAIAFIRGAVAATSISQAAKTVSNAAVYLVSL